MLKDNFKPAEDDPLERLLDRFTPVASRIDRDQLMFRAGISAAQAMQLNRPIVRPQDRVWPALAILTTAAALVLGVAIWHRPAAEVIVVERPAAAAKVPVSIESVKATELPKQVEARETIPNPIASLDPAANYLLQRDRVLREGLDALASAGVESSSFSKRALPTQRQLFQELPGEFHRPSVQVDSDEWWQAWLNSGDRS